MGKLIFVIFVLSNNIWVVCSQLLYVEGILFCNGSQNAFGKPWFVKGALFFSGCVTMWCMQSESTPAYGSVIISETRMPNVRLNACFQKNFLKIIRFLEENAKRLKAGQLLLLVCFGAKFFLLKSVCLAAQFLVSITAKLLFANTAKLLLKARHVIFSFSFASCDAVDMDTCVQIT